MSTLHRIMQQELEVIDRRMEHLAAERGRIVEAMKVLEGEQQRPTTDIVRTELIAGKSYWRRDRLVRTN